MTTAMVSQLVLALGLAGTAGADDNAPAKAEGTTAPIKRAGGAGRGEFNYKTVQQVVFDREKKAVPDIYVLEFTFRNPRYIMADIPGKGRKLVWYMKYKIVNRTDKPRLFIPTFTLVTDKGKVYKDTILPRAERAVMNQEDPTQPLLNSVMMSEKPIPPTPAESNAITRTGVVFWEDVDLETKSFSVFVSGLSNGYVRVYDDKAQKEVLRKKTLQLNFKKLGDQFLVDNKEIRLEGDPIWDYR